MFFLNEEREGFWRILELMSSGDLSLKYLQILFPEIFNAKSKFYIQSASEDTSTKTEGTFVFLCDTLIIH